MFRSMLSTTQPVPEPWVAALPASVSSCFIRAARLQNEIAPEKNDIYTTKSWKKPKKDPKNDPKVSDMFFAPLWSLKHISLALFYFFTAKNLRIKTYFFTATFWGGHATVLGKASSLQTSVAAYAVIPRRYPSDTSCLTN